MWTITLSQDGIGKVRGRRENENKVGIIDSYNANSRRVSSAFIDFIGAAMCK